MVNALSRRTKKIHFLIYVTQPLTAVFQFEVKNTKTLAKNKSFLKYGLSVHNANV